MRPKDPYTFELWILISVSESKRHIKESHFAIDLLWIPWTESQRFHRNG